MSDMDERIERLTPEQQSLLRAAAQGHRLLTVRGGINDQVWSRLGAAGLMLDDSAADTHPMWRTWALTAEGFAHLKGLETDAKVEG